MGLVGVGSQEEAGKEFEVKEGLSFRFVGGAYLGDDGVFSPEMGELLKCRTMK